MISRTTLMSASDPAAASSREKEIFMAALDVDDPAAQAAYLDSACAGDADLRARVERLLGLEADSRSFLQPPSMMRKGVEALEEPDFDATIQLAPAALPRQIVPPPISASAANPDSPVPFVFGRRIAQGGMGAILEASDCKLGRTIAVKIMLSEAACSEDQKQRFIQEAAVLGRLEHPNIVPIHDLGRDSEGSLYYTMKLVKGRTLQRILDDLRHEDKEALEHYTLDRLLTIFRKVCDALAFAHAQKIIHRDLKPENIMVGEFGEVLVMDWGIAKVLGQSDHETIRQGDAAAVPVSLSPSLPVSPSSLSGTLEGAVMGTPQYMSPEQALGQVTDMDARSDIFSLGGILYAILTLRPPVEGKDVWEVIEKVSTARIAAPTTFGATTTGTGKAKAKGEVLEAKKITPLPHMPGGRVPNALSAVAMKALTLDKTKRYQDIAAFSADIEAYQGGFATTAEQAGLAKQIALLIKRNKGIFTTAAAAWLLITGLAVWFVFNLRAKEQRATQAEVIAVQERETARQALAKSQLDVAEKEFERGKFVESQKILGETPESFRDANWRFLQAHSRDFTAQLSLGLTYGSVNRLQFLPQGDRFAVRRWGGVIGVFTVAGRQIGGWIPVSGGKYDAFGIDRSGDRMAFPVSASEIAVQEVATGKLVGRWPCEPGESKNVLLSPDGGTVLVSCGNQLIAYAAQTGAPLWTQPNSWVAPAFSPDGRTVAVLAAKEGLNLKVQLLDAITGAVRSTLEATADNPAKTTLQFNQAGDQLACLGEDEVILWNAKTTAKIRALHFPGENVKLLNPSGTTVATINGSRIRLWDTTTGRLLRSLHGASTIVHDVAFSPDEKLLISGHDVGVVNVWPVRLDEGIASARVEPSNGRRVLFGRDGTGFYALAGRTIAALETRSGIQRWKFLSERLRFLDLAVHPSDGTIILSEQNKPTLTRLSSAGEAPEAFVSITNPSLKFNRSGQLLLAAAGASFSVFEYSSGKERQKITLDKTSQPFAAFCLDDAAVATAASAGGITVWDWQAGKPLRQIEAAQTGSIGCLTSSPDGLHLATGGPDRWIRIWDAATGRLEAAFRAHWEGVRCLKFSPDGREILSGSEDGSVRIHDAATGEEALAFYGLTAPVADVDISADGTQIAAISTDGFTQVWDRQRSSAAALLPKKPRPVLPKDADGWEDLLAQLTEAKVAEIGNGWSLKNGELFSPNKIEATLPLPGEVSGTSYSVRVKLRQLPAKRVFHIVLPVADRMCGLDLEGRFGGIYTGLVWVNGKYGKNLPGTVEGKLVNDTEPHDLEVTVRLDGANATITTTLDGKPLYEWTGPTAALSQHTDWATTEPGDLALGTNEAGWAVSSVKLKRLEAGGPNPEPKPAAPKAISNASASSAALPVEKPKPTLPKDADGWEDLLASLTPEQVEKTGKGWRFKDGELFSPNANFATLPLPGEVSVSGTSYSVRVKLRQLPTKNVFYITLPVADRMCGFELEGRPHPGIFTGLSLVNGKNGKNLPGVVEGKQVNDTEPHDLEVTVRLDGANATIAATLDGQPLYEWTGPTAALSQFKLWATTKPGSLALGTWGGGWVVSEVKLKRLLLPSAKANAPALPASPPAREFKTGEWIPPAPSQEPLRKQGTFVEVSRDAEYQVQPLGYTSNEGIQQLLAGLPEGQKLDWAFHTQYQPEEANQPHIIIRLKKPANLRQVAVENRRWAEFHERAKGLTLWLSADGQEWRQVWQAENPQAEWLIELGTGQQAQYLKLGLPGKGILHLREVVVYGDGQP